MGLSDLQFPYRATTAATHFELLSRMASSGTPEEVAAAIVHFAASLPECESAIVAWGLSAGPTRVIPRFR